MNPTTDNEQQADVIPAHLEHLAQGFSKRGYIDYLDSHVAIGRVIDDSDFATVEPLEITITIDGKYTAFGWAELYWGNAGLEYRFNIDISEFTAGKWSFSLDISLRGDDRCLLKAPVEYFSKEYMIESIHDLAVELREDEREKPGLPAYFGALHNKYIQYLRNDVSGAGMFVQIGVQTSVQTSSMRDITVVVPVYDGFDETTRCLDALLKSRAENRLPFHVVIVDDCGPDPILRRYLATYEYHGDVRLLRNECNQGFVKSVNRAMLESAGHDIVLLNADAIVHGNWIDRLRSAAYSSAAVASVTPFSNNATICSYPDPALQNPMPSELDLAAIDEICREENRGIAVEIPTAVGFCMYMRHDALDDVGIFDANRWGRGYGEENDWCMRARDRGWKHLHACDTFVEHIGSVSFGEEKTSLIEEHSALLSRLYPEYASVIEAFFAKAPNRHARNNITIRRMRKRLDKFDQRVLYVSHAIGGGIDTFCRDMTVRLHKQNIGVVMLQGERLSRMTVRYGDLEAVYDQDTDFAELEADLVRLSLSRIHMNSDVDSITAVWKLPEVLGIPLDVTVHDYLFVCPRINFMMDEGGYCNEPVKPESCNRCIDKNGTSPRMESRFVELGNDVGGWRKFYHRQLTGAQHVYVPDEDVAMRMKRYFPALAVTVQPHPVDGRFSRISPPVVAEGETLRVAVLGAIGRHKGFDRLLACVRHAHLFGLPMHFIVVGYTCDDQALLRYPNVSITGQYEATALPKIIVEQDLHLALFLSECPETYSYTLTEALLAKLFPIAMPSGALASRLKRLNCGLILGENPSAAEINAVLCDLACQSGANRTKRTIG